MGNSLHNKSYLGRRAALLNLKRMQNAACSSAMAGVELILMMVRALA